MRCCVTPCGQTDVGSSQKIKIFLPFRVLLNVGIDPDFSQKSFFFFFGFIQREISLSSENIFSLATVSAKRRAIFLSGLQNARKLLSTDLVNTRYI